MAPVIAELFGMNNAQAGLLVGGIALIYAIQRWRKNVVTKGRRTAEERPGANAPAGGASAKSMRAVTGEVQALLADLEETSRRLTAQLDNRYTRLEVLMAEADRKIARLEALEKSVNAGTMVKAAVSPSAPPTAPVSAAHGRVPEGERMLARMREERGAVAVGEEPAYQPVFALADRGKNVREIAQELGRQPGEIELILALRRREEVGR